MRATGSCSTHPSREARLRCRSCHRWICDRCVRVVAGHIYCSRACRVADLERRLVGWLRALAARPVHPIWAATVAVAAAGLLLAAIAGHLATLVELAMPAGELELGQRRAPAPPTPIPLAGRVSRSGRGWQLEVSGPPRATVAVVAGERPLALLELDDGGTATLADLRLDPQAPVVELALLERRVTVVGELAPPPAVAPATPAPAPTATAPSAAPPATAPPARPRRSYPGAPPILHHVPDAGARIALSFDGGSKSEGAAEVMRVLDATGVKASLFLTGEFIAREPALVRAAVLAGHEVGNHSYDHPHLTTYELDRNQSTRAELTRAAFEDQLRRTELAFRAATGKPMAPLWRAPFGEENTELRAWALELGYLHVRWSSLEGRSLDSLDWISDEHSSLYRAPEQMMKRLLRFPRLEGGVVLMHLASDRSDHPASAVPYFVAELAHRGIATVRVSDLLEASPTWRPWLERAQENHARAWGG